MKTEAEKVAEFCVNFSFSNLPDDVVWRAKHLILDILGVAIRGSILDSSIVMMDLVKEMRGIPESTVIGRKKKVPAANAALANGTMAHGIEMDDVDTDASLHPGVAVIPAALAMAERQKIDGMIFITSVVLGYEIMIRIGKAIGYPSSYYSRGFHATSVAGVFGGAVAAGKILNLPAEKLVWSMGIAGSQASGLLEFLKDGSWTKRMHPGWAAHSAVIAAILADKRFTGPATILEGEQGFLKAYSEKFDPAMVTDGLGKSFAIMNTSVKLYACCRYSISAVDAALKLVKENNILPGDVEVVTLRTFKKAIPLVVEPLEIKYAPRSVVDAQFSMPFAIAIAILKRRAFIDEFSEALIRDPEVLQLMKKIKIVYDPELDKDFPKVWPAQMEIKTRTGGKTYETLVKTLKGDSENPLIEKEFQEKFEILAESVIPAGTIAKIEEKVKGLEKLKDINELTRLLV